MRKVLIVEDDLEIAELEKQYLELSDFDVSVESDGIMGEKKAMSGEYDMIILDLLLPGKDGFQICRKYRSKYQKPVIMVTAKTEDIDLLSGLGLGADDYIKKPFRLVEFVARVKNRMERYDVLTGQTAENENVGGILELSGLRMEKAEQRTFVNGEEIDLGPKEFALLYALAERPNHLYSHEELHRKVWGVSSSSNVGDVRECVKKVRHKIKSAKPGTRYIKTVSGKGYRFLMDE